MTNKIVISIDAMGGENAPAKCIEGVALFIKKNKSNDFIIQLHGEEENIISELKKNNIYKHDQIEIFKASSVVSDEDTPLTAIKNSKDSSMWNAIEAQTKKNADISLSAGNTGVMLVISRMILKMIDSVKKPALAALWPNEKGFNVVLDLGANVECDENNLVEFAEMGAALFKSIFPNEEPKAALLNIGSEEMKGTETLKKAFQKLDIVSQKNIFKFNGYIEPNKITYGESNVIVTDGFTGNISLKTAEGTAKFITDNLKKYLLSNWLSKFSLIFSYFSLKKFKERLDPRRFNGAIFLGLNGPVVKSHGATDSLGFYYSIDLCYKIVRGDLMKKIKANLNE